MANNAFSRSYGAIPSSSTSADAARALGLLEGWALAGRISDYAANILGGAGFPALQRQPKLVAWMRAAERRNAAMGQLDQLALEAHVDDMQRFDLHYEREDRKLKRDVQAVERLRVQREHDGLMHSCQ